MRALHLFALCGFAIAQPLLELLARHAELFVAHRSEPIDIIDTDQRQAVSTV